MQIVGRFPKYDTDVTISSTFRGSILMVKALHGSTIRPFRGCENAAGKLRQKWQATAGPKFTKPGNGLIVQGRAGFNYIVNAIYNRNYLRSKILKTDF